MEGNLREREEGRGRREIFFHCMPAAALISWSILVNNLTEETADRVTKRKKEAESCVFQYLRVQQFFLNHVELSVFPYIFPTPVVKTNQSEVLQRARLSNNYLMM